LAALLLPLARKKVSHTHTAPIISASNAKRCELPSAHGLRQIRHALS